MTGEGELRLPTGCDRIVVDLRSASVEAAIDHAGAPNDEWAFGISRLQVPLGDGALAYVDGFGRLRRIRVRLGAEGVWFDRLRAICRCNADELVLAEQVARIVATFGAPSVRAEGPNPAMVRSTGSIAGRVALVTGASRGIGAAIAKRLAAAGAHVAVVARTFAGHSAQSDEAIDTALIDTVNVIREWGGVVEPVLGDLSNPSAPEEIVSAVSDRLGPIDVLVNNAARATYMPVGQWNRRAVEKLFQVNVLSPFALCNLLLPGMKERRFGAVVNVSSIVADHPIGPPYGLFERMSFTTLYGMAKAALDRMSSGLAIESCDDGVQINSISPSGGARTPGALAASQMFNRFPQYAEPLESIAEAVLALCEPGEPMITGRVLTSGALLADLGRPVRGLDGGPFEDPCAVIDLRDDASSEPVDHRERRESDLRRE